MHNSSNFFLVLAGLMGLPMLLLALSLTTGSYTAWMIFGVFFYTIGIPFFGAFVTCLLIGLGLRFKSQNAHPSMSATPGADSSQSEDADHNPLAFRLRWVFDRLVLLVGVCLLCMAVKQMHSFGYVSNFLNYGIGSDTDFPIFVALAYLLVPFANPTLPLGLGATAYGLARLRKPSWASS